MSVNDRMEALALKSFVARNLRRARTEPVVGEPMSLHRAAQEIGGPTLQGTSVHQWESGHVSPGPKRLRAVVAWIEMRLGISAGQTA